MPSREKTSNPLSLRPLNARTNGRKKSCFYRSKGVFPLLFLNFFLSRVPLEKKGQFGAKKKREGLKPSSHQPTQFIIFDNELGRLCWGEKRAKQRSQSQIIKTRGEVKGRQGSKIYADPPVRSNASKKKAASLPS